MNCATRRRSLATLGSQLGEDTVTRVNRQPIPVQWGATAIAAVVLSIGVIVASLSGAASEGLASPAEPFTGSAVVSPALVSTGQSTTVTVTVTSAQAATVLVDVEIWTPDNSKRLFVQWWDSQPFRAGETRQFTATWQVQADAPLGTLPIQVGVFTPGTWEPRRAWNAQAGSVTVAVNCLSVPAYREIRPANTTANRTPGAPIPASYRQEFNPGFDAYKAQVTGQGCLGTTEQILEWAARKWGFADQPSPFGGPALKMPDLAKAMAVQESDWRQWLQGDNHSGQCAWTGGSACPYPDGYQSYGILQVKRTSWPGSYPLSAQSTAFAADYAMAAVRHHYDGASWLPSLKGDLWGAVEAWYTGKNDASGDGYRARVYNSYLTKPWTQPGY